MAEELGLNGLLANPAVELAVVLLVALGLSYLANFWLSRILLGRRYVYFTAPGIVLHELSHAVACVLTGARIRRVVLVSRRGGEVEHEPPRVPGGQAVISLAPLVGAVLALRLLLELAEVGVAVWLPAVYLALAVVVTMTPGKQDLLTGGTTMGAIGLLAVVIGESEPLASYLGLLLGSPSQAFLIWLELAVALLAAVAGLSGLAYAWLGRTIRRGVRYRVD